MRNVLPWSSDRPCGRLSGIGAADRRLYSGLPAGLAAFAGADCGGHIPIPMLTGGSAYDEGGRLEKPEIPAGHPVQAVSHYMREKQRRKGLCFFHILRNKLIW